MSSAPRTKADRNTRNRLRVVELSVAAHEVALRVPVTVLRKERIATELIELVHRGVNSFWQRQRSDAHGPIIFGEWPDDQLPA
ncbi:MAG TPA: hypothetical protein VK273_12110 [Gaiellaceae bacterium]|nr:hypothetical protein [Gaiellaceae bacterium]